MAKIHFITTRVDHPSYFQFSVVVFCLSFISPVEQHLLPTLKISISGNFYVVESLTLLKHIFQRFISINFKSFFNYSDAFYFCFVAFCTVGFGGDWVRLSTDFGIWLIVIYIFLGVTLLSTTLHIVHQVSFCFTQEELSY